MRSIRTTATLGALLAALALPTAAPAETALAVKAGTLGLGLELSQRLGSDRLTGRLGYFAYSHDEEFSTDEVTYDGEADLETATAILDFHPFAGAFRLSVGAAWSGSAFTGEAPVRPLLDEGDLDDFPVPLPDDLGRLTAEAELEPLAPYAGIGWGNAASRSGSAWTFSLDLGVIYHGTPDVAVAADLPADVDDLIDSVPGARQLLDEALAEEEAELQEEVDEFELYPVIALSVGYRF